ncbi:ATPase [Marinoscillum sp. MHG1-6]|uniref:ATPase n=1 Tax=Marinoscillum sp. MHG1-6 TaxID=2959627 RepID=UPI002157C304|nr:ATPase [Marinoscillum sp. MHG1-6]
MNPKYKIRKYSGDLDVFSEDKLVQSLENSGVKRNAIDYVRDGVTKELYDGISTKEIYQIAHKLLRKKEFAKASQYRLKQSLIELGPTGYPFELFVSELMKAEGYETKTSQIMEGKCVSHEVDVLAENEFEVMMIECKFHNKAGYKSDVKIPLYIQSRFVDLRDQWQQTNQFSGKRPKGAIATNTRFTEDAIAYGTCTGLMLMSWDFPEKGSLKQLVNKHMLYPITSLQTLTKKDKQTLIEQGIVATKMLCDHFDLLDQLRLPNSKLQKVITEANLVCEL